VKNVIIALRNLNRQKKRSFLLGGAIAFGILIVTLINGFTGSFVRNVGENFSNIFAGHIFIEGVEKEDDGSTRSIIRDDVVLNEIITAAEIPSKFITRRSEFRGTLLFQGDSVSQNIVGAEWAQESFFRDRLLLTSGTFDALIDDPSGIILSEEIAHILNVEIGDRILVRNRTISGQQNVGEFRLVATSYDPGMFGALSAYANLCYVNELLDIECDEYKTLGIMLESLGEIDKYAELLYEKLALSLPVFDRERASGEDNPVEALFEQEDEEEWEGTRYRYYTLNDVLAQADQIVRILNVAGVVILLVLFVIIMVGITNTFRMIMIERIKEIGTMRALGMQRQGIRSLFLLEALFLALGGALIGLALAGVAMIIISRIFWGFDTPIFILLKNGYITFKLVPLQVLLHFSIVAVLTMLAAFFPARNAANLHPVDALRAI
jgi:putative ABC transport system permease protein